MIKAFRIGAALSVVALFAGSAAAQSVDLNGAGATFPYPIYSKWFSEYNKLHPDVQINYQPLGSGAEFFEAQSPRHRTSRLASHAEAWSSAARTVRPRASAALPPFASAIVTIAVSQTGERQG